MMKHASISGLLALFLSSCIAVAQPAPTTASAADPEIDKILDALDARGKSMTSLVADLTKKEVDEIAGDTTSRGGKIWLQRKADGSYRVHILLETKTSGNVRTNEKLEFLLDDGKFTDRNYHSKTETTRQVLRPGQKMDLFKLGEGPFPLPLGQSKEDVHKAFDVTQQPSSKDDPAGTVRLRLTPKPGTDIARKFKKIESAIDPKQDMPIRIDTTSLDDTRSTWELNKVQVNQPLDDSKFKLEKIDPGSWNINFEPYEN